MCCAVSPASTEVANIVGNAKDGSLCCRTEAEARVLKKDRVSWPWSRQQPSYTAILFGIESYSTANTCYSEASNLSKQLITPLTCVCIFYQSINQYLFIVWYDMSNIPTDNNAF